jgi:hypothetical protein
MCCRSPHVVQRSLASKSRYPVSSGCRVVDAQDALTQRVDADVARNLRNNGGCLAEALRVLAARACR